MGAFGRRGSSGQWAVTARSPPPPTSDRNSFAFLGPSGPRRCADPFSFSFGQMTNVVRSYTAAGGQAPVQTLPTPSNSTVRCEALWLGWNFDLAHATQASYSKEDAGRVAECGCLKAVWPCCLGFVFEVWPARLRKRTPKNPARLPSGTQPHWHL
jgi:hypothetical protein